MFVNPYSSRDKHCRTPPHTHTYCIRCFRILCTFYNVLFRYIYIYYERRSRGFLSDIQGNLFLRLPVYTDQLYSITTDTKRVCGRPLQSPLYWNTTCTSCAWLVNIKVTGMVYMEIYANILPSRHHHGVGPRQQRPLALGSCLSREKKTMKIKCMRVF